MTTWKRTLLSFAAGCVASMVLAPIQYYSSWPARLNHFRFDDLFDIGLLSTLWVAMPGLLLLCALSWRRPRSPAASAMVVSAVLMAEALYRAIPPLRYTGRFPFWIFERDFLPFLPLALAAGLAFGMASRRYGRGHAS